MNSYIKLGIATLLPVIAAIILYLLDKRTDFGKINGKVKQVLIGIVFGALAIVGTEWGIPMNGAQVNCRDGAVLIAGLMFGGPAGIIAGIIGAAERWIAVAWGVGTYTRVACTVSTMLAGFFAAALRKYMFEGRKPGWGIAFAIGVVMEVFHLTMVFITNMDTPDKAMTVIQSCSIPMVTANGLAVLLAAVILTLMARNKDADRSEGQVKISQTIQRWLFITVVCAFVITSAFIFKLQNEIANTQADNLLTMAIDEVAADIEDASNRSITIKTEEIAEKAKTEGLLTLAEEYGVAEINVFDRTGTVVQSSVTENIGEKAGNYEQSREFLELLGDKTYLVQGFRANATPADGDETIIRKYAGVKTENGFIQVGYDAEHVQASIDQQVVDITRNRHVGQTGYVLIINDQYDLISAPAGMTNETLMRDGSGIGAVEHDITIKMPLNGEDAFCRYRMAEGYYIISVLPAAEAHQLRDVALYVNSYLEILVFAVLFGLIYMLVKKVVVNRIEDINTSLARITCGDLDEVVNVRSNKEFASLSDDINATVDTLKRYIEEASARIDAELEFAKSIQASALPNVFPAFPKRKDFDIFASMNPAKEVGGDFYDFYITGNDTLNFLVADVSGKGIPAAMFMMRAKTELKTLTEAETPLRDVFTLGNNALCEGNDAGMFVTAWQGGVDLETGLMQYVSAGHNPPLVCRAGGKFEYLRSRAGFVLAGMEGVQYNTKELQLEPGDTVFLYTDGVTEATNADKVLFGEERLLEAINSREYGSMDELCGFVKAEVDAFVGEAPQFDDITMVAFRYLGEPPVPTFRSETAALQDIPDVTAFMEAELEKLDFPMKSTMQISVAIDEIYSNIVRYAYPDGSGPVTVKFIVRDDPRSVYIRFEDDGIPYNPLTNKDPDVTLSAEDRTVGGLGIYMVKKTMDGVAYKYENEHNILTLKKLY